MKGNPFDFEQVKNKIQGDSGLLVIEQLEPYKNVKSKLLLLCTCNREFVSCYYDFTRQKHKCCFSCAKKAAGKTKVLTQKECEAKASLYNIKLISQYVDSRSDLTFECHCGNEFKKSWNTFINSKSKSCPSCGIAKRGNLKRNPYELIKKRASMYGAKLLTTKAQWDNKDHIIPYFNCIKCNQEYSRHIKYLGKYSNLCNNCSSGMPTSKTERKLSSWLEELNINIEKNNRKLIKPKEIDILLPDYNLAIEVNGLYYHSDSRLNNKNYHLNKTKMIEQKGYSLLHFWDIEIDNKLDIVKSMILSKIGMIKSSIYARKCLIKQVDSKEARIFLENNHLAGFASAKYHYGLYYNKSLVSLISIGSSRFKRNEFEIIRYANKTFTNVVGGFSRLFKYVLKTHDIQEIASYADRRYSSGKVYESNGFKLVSSTPPSYWYFKDGEFSHRSKYQKHKICNNSNKHLTEKEIMINNGYDLVYDCGNLKYIYNEVPKTLTRNGVNLR